MMVDTVSLPQYQHQLPPKLTLILVKTTQPQEMIQEVISVATMTKVSQMNQMQQIPRMLSSEPQRSIKNIQFKAPTVCVVLTGSCIYHRL
jgi:hypothetical protein